MASQDLKKLICEISPEGVPGGLRVDGKPHSYSRYRTMFENALEVRKIDDMRELRTPYYPGFKPFDYQREAVLRMLGRFRGKGIFGDQVGLGKTIEVGMTVTEFAERSIVQNVLLLCPAKLVFQWSLEIEEKFSAYFKGAVIRDLSEISGKGTEGDVTMFIMSFDALRKNVQSVKGLLTAERDAALKELDKEKFERVKSEAHYAAKARAEALSAELAALGSDVDERYLRAFGRRFVDEVGRIGMLVVDEADALLSGDPRRTTQIYRIVEYLADPPKSENLPKIPYRILMSATPIRRQLDDVYKLMRIVRPEQFADRKDFIDNYCFGKEQLSDFEGTELNKLKGIIDQLFTRNRLSSGNVQRALMPMGIDRAAKLRFENYFPGFKDMVRGAVFDGLAYKEKSFSVEALRQKVLYADDWTDYVLYMFFSPETQKERPFEVTPEKTQAFADSLLRRLEGVEGAEIDEIRFAVTDYVIPEKKGHLIPYTGRVETDRKTVLDAAKEARDRRAISAQMDPEADQRNTVDRYDRAEIDCDSIYIEFDRLVNELLKDRKVVVFSNTNAVRENFIGIVEAVCPGRALSGKDDARSENYLKFKSDDPRYKNAVYFAVNGEEKGVNMQFCSDLIITDLSHDPNLVEQIVGRISRIGQRSPMDIYVFARKSSLEHTLYRFYNDTLHLFSDWDGDNTFIIGGAVTAFLNRNPKIRDTLSGALRSVHKEGEEHAEVRFEQIVEHLYRQYEAGATVGPFSDNELWRDFVDDVERSIVAFRELVREFGIQETAVEEDDKIL